MICAKKTILSASKQNQREKTKCRGSSETRFPKVSRRPEPFSAVFGRSTSAAPVSSLGWSWYLVNRLWVSIIDYKSTYNSISLLLSSSFQRQTLSPTANAPFQRQTHSPTANATSTKFSHKMFSISIICDMRKNRTRVAWCLAANVCSRRHPCPSPQHTYPSQSRIEMGRAGLWPLAIFFAHGPCVF